MIPDDVATERWLSAPPEPDHRREIEVYRAGDRDEDGPWMVFRWWAETSSYQTVATEAWWDDPDVEHLTPSWLGHHHTREWHIRNGWRWKEIAAQMNYHGWRLRIKPVSPIRMES